MKKIFISILLMLTTNLLALENEKSISKEQQEFFEKEIVSQLKAHGDCKVVKTYKEIYTYKNGKYSLNK
ncbi:hypothetical protein EI285_06020 [Aliarcobacter skirrowii]|uniref:hypothetical protein n=1 Tax=Aliarcobacter skirrowii TaxID=28200 RepID=UPI000F6823EB|nr:hypothetical protein [Aliarcobacter skirrowii]AZL54161.1 hypothetical protein EI285_06020 [Aliarcobacter skirrowii]